MRAKSENTRRVLRRIQQLASFAGSFARAITEAPIRIEEWRALSLPKICTIAATHVKSGTTSPFNFSS